ncbi:hypothetical protein A2V82_06835, partial [candidate division KSB1 bacterium RBG_16_48_16]
MKALTQSVKSQPLSTWQLSILTMMRVAIGWHFLYEGMVKLTNPNWTCAGFLSESKWLFSGLFHWIAGNPAVLKIVDLLNIWGLLLIGLGLFFGCLTRLATFSAIGLLLLYYIANPPFVGLANSLATEGSYLVVDKNLVELIALVVLIFFPTGSFFGIDRLLAKKRKSEFSSPVHEPQVEKQTATKATASISLGRREVLKNLVTLPLFGGFVYAYLRKRGWESYEEKHLKYAADMQTDALSGATIKTFRYSTLKNLKGKVPAGNIGNLKVSRLLLGGNLIGGWAHARDLIYVSKLVKSYHTDRKIFDTLSLAERCGINTLLTNPQLCRVINEY